MPLEERRCGAVPGGGLCRRNGSGAVVTPKGPADVDVAGGGSGGCDRLWCWPCQLAEGRARQLEHTKRVRAEISQAGRIRGGPREWTPACPWGWWVRVVRRVVEQGGPSPTPPAGLSRRSSARAGARSGRLAAPRSQLRATGRPITGAPRANPAARRPGGGDAHHGRPRRRRRARSCLTGGGVGRSRGWPPHAAPVEGSGSWAMRSRPSPTVPMSRVRPMSDVDTPQGFPGGQVGAGPGFRDAGRLPGVWERRQRHPLSMRGGPTVPAGVVDHSTGRQRDVSATRPDPACEPVVIPPTLSRGAPDPLPLAAAVAL